MKVLVTGANGQLGYDLVLQLKKRGHTVLETDVSSMDITDMEQVRDIISNFNPKCVIHCAAWTAVDSAEENEIKCKEINADGTNNIVEICKEIDAKLIYLSTDYVFSGDGETPFKPDDKRNPINIYGKTKCEGEEYVQTLKKFFIVRISWVFGKNGNNFVKTMLNLANYHNEITVVDDQIGSPTYTYDLSSLLIDMAESEKYGIYHASNEGDFISWYDFAKEIYKITNKDISVIPVKSSEYKTKARRPKNSRMDKSRLRENGFTPLPDWHDALKRFLIEIKVIDNESN